MAREAGEMGGKGKGSVRERQTKTHGYAGNGKGGRKAVGQGDKRHGQRNTPVFGASRGALHVFDKRRDGQV